MNRRNFLTTSTLLGASVATPIFSSTVLADTSPISIFDIGKGFNKISNQIENIPVKLLSQDVIVAHNRLLNTLNTEGYIYNSTKITKLSNFCFAIPLSKNPLIGFKTKELALLIKENQKIKHYILNERISFGLNSLIESFSQNMDSNKLNIDILSFIAPAKIIKESYGRESVFTYENEQKNKITLKSSSKKNLAFVS
ncbi:hypothetical protein [Aquimarina aquimarini]|uniref:hypothetical protein n=1 Tax=Aquimarina aquimarini TaxID=1191734 RepID=UPI000D551D9E|nr:hypothetical protein [Aquimarina aquimarini]